MDLEVFLYKIIRAVFLKGPKYFSLACRVLVHFQYLEREGLINIGKYCFEAFMATGGLLFELLISLINSFVILVIHR